MYTRMMRATLRPATKTSTHAEGRKPLLHLFLGRHQSAASGLWVYAFVVLREIINFFEAVHQGGLETPGILVTFGGDEELHSRLENLIEGSELDITLRMLPKAFGSRRISMVADLFHGPIDATLTHGMANLIPLAVRSTRILTLHDVLQADSPAPAGNLYVSLRRLFYRALLRFQCRLAHVVLTDHDLSRSQLAHFTKRRDKIAIVYPPLDTAYLEAPLRTSFKPTGSLLAFASRDPRKNIEGLMRAYSGWQNRNRWNLKILSNSEIVTGHLKVLAASLGMESSVQFLEAIPQYEMPLLYESVDALLFPSLGEGFGYPLYEALSQGVPVLCAKGTIIGPLAQYVRNMVVEASSLTVSGLTDAVERVASLHVPVEDRRHAAESVRTALSPDFMVREILNIYRRHAPHLFKSRQL